RPRSRSRLVQFVSRHQRFVAVSCCSISPGFTGLRLEKSIPFRRTIRKKVYFFAVSSSRKYTFLPLTPRWGAHGRAAGATSSPANERCATPQRHRGAFPDRNGRAAALGSELAADPGSWGRPDGSKRTASFAERVRVYRAGGDCGTITFWPIPRFRPHLVVAHTLARAERAALQDPGPREADEQRARGVRGRIPRRDEPLRSAENPSRSDGARRRGMARTLTRAFVESILVNRSAG